MYHPLFVTDKDEVKVNIYWVMLGDGTLLASHAPESLIENFEGVTKDVLKVNTFVFRRPSFHDTVLISRDIMTDGRTLGFNPWHQRYMRMKMLLKSWDFTDIEGKPIEASVDNLNAIDPVIADAAAMGLESKIGGI